MKFHGEAIFLGAKHQEAKEPYPAAWFINLAEAGEGGDSMSFRARDEVMTYATQPAKLALVEIEVEVVDKPGYGDKPGKRDVQLVRIRPVAPPVAIDGNSVPKAAAAVK